MGLGPGSGGVGGLDESTARAGCRTSRVLLRTRGLARLTRAMPMVSRRACDLTQRERAQVTCGVGARAREGTKARGVHGAGMNITFRAVISHVKCEM